MQQKACDMVLGRVILFLSNIVYCVVKRFKLRCMYSRSGALGEFASAWPE